METVFPLLTLTRQKEEEAPIMGAVLLLYI